MICVAWGILWAMSEGAFRASSGESALLILSSVAASLPLIVGLLVVGMFWDRFWARPVAAWQLSAAFMHNVWVVGFTAFAALSLWAAGNFALTMLINPQIQQPYFESALGALVSVGLFVGIAFLAPVFVGIAQKIAHFVVRRRLNSGRWKRIWSVVMLAVVAATLLEIQRVDVLQRLPWVYVVGPVVGFGLAAVGAKLWRPKTPRPFRVAFGVAILHLGLMLLPSSMAHVRQDISADPSYAAAQIRVLLKITDFDQDGESALYAGSDCAGFDANRSTKAFDVPDNGIDDDCDGVDASSANWPKSGSNFVEHPAPERLPHILMVTTDALSYTHTNLGGYAQNVTPRLKEFADESVSFTRAYSNAPTTYMSLPIIHTGLPYTDLTVTRGRKNGDYPFGLDKNTPTLAAQLKKLGYHTIFIPGHRYFLDTNFEGIATGFDEVETDAPMGFAHSAGRVTSRVIDRLRDATQRTFIWVHYFDHHEPYLRSRTSKEFPVPPGPLGTKVSNYDSEVEATDREWGRLFNFVRKKPDDYIVVFTSDHGESFDELHRIKPHSHCIRTSETHVPLVFYVPGQKPGQIDGLAAHMDIAPTLLNLLGVKPSEAMAGESLVPSIFRGEKPQKGAIFQSYYDPRRTDPKTAFMQYGAVNEHYLYFRDLDNSVTAVFDANDPLQKTPVADPSKAQNLRQFAEHTYHGQTKDPKGLFNRK